MHILFTTITSQTSAAAEAMGALVLAVFFGAAGLVGLVYLAAKLGACRWFGFGHTFGRSIHGHGGPSTEQGLFRCSRCGIYTMAGMMMGDICEEHRFHAESEAVALKKFHEWVGYLPGD